MALINPYKILTHDTLTFFLIIFLLHQSDTIKAKNLLIGLQPELENMDETTSKIKINVQGNYTGNEGQIECHSEGGHDLKSLHYISCSTFHHCDTQANQNCLQDPENCEIDNLYEGTACNMNMTFDPEAELICLKAPIKNDNNPGGIIGCNGESNSTEIDFFALGADLKYHVINDPSAWIPMALWVGNDEIFSSHYFYIDEEAAFACYATRFLFYETLQIGVIFINDTIIYNDENIRTDCNDYFWSIVKLINVTQNMKGIACKAARISNETSPPWDFDWEENQFLFETRTKEEEPQSKPKKGPNYGLSIGLSVFIVTIVLTIGIFILWRKYTAAKNQLRNLSQEEVEEFKDGCPKLNLLGQFKQEFNNNNQLAISMPFDPKFEIPVTDIFIDKHSVLGQGQFGLVLQGNWKGLPVAVKTIKAHVDVTYFKALLGEIKVMAYIGNHENIVKFFGALTTKIQQRIVYVVVELSCVGDLSSFLKKKRHEFEIYEQTAVSYIDMKVLKNLTNYCYQIANGMKHLESKKVIHGDLAIRNILVFENNLVKISDFGLSRRMYDYTKYIKKQRMVLPFRWMPPEALLYNEFSIQSDIWSYGVVVWEIFSYGAIPFADESWSLKFMERLQKGHRLDKPLLAPTFIYNQVLKCWAGNPTNRPSFETLYNFFHKTISDLLKDI